MGVYISVTILPRNLIPCSRESDLPDTKRLTAAPSHHAALQNFDIFRSADFKLVNFIGV